MNKLLFVCYGSGHVRMVLPVARALRNRRLAEVAVLALTTAAAEAQAAGFPVLRFKDFVDPVADAAALAHGRRLVTGLQQVVDPEESIAYLGMSYADLEDEVGPKEAARRYARDGRQAFLPRRSLRRLLGAIRPQLVVATNSPRAERAAIEAAGELGIPAVCLVDLFAIDEVRWIAQPGYAQHVCVLNEQVRALLLAAGRRPDEVVVTGNPAFDALRDPALASQGRELRTARGWAGKRVLLWPTQVEPALHPFDGRQGDPGLPERALQSLVQWTLRQPDAILCVRPRPGEAAPALPADRRIVLTGQDWPLVPLLHAVDVVVTLSSTVGLEGHLAGARLVQVRGSVFEDAMPLARFGIADAAVPLDGLTAALDRWSHAGRRPPRQGENATERVLSVLHPFL
ncbi:MAG TPA: UDP-glycosyltransferase [Ramlibacter sp.]|nr:UDP-glycosyltransferase [Ramlibacter sp.]